MQHKVTHRSHWYIRRGRAVEHADNANLEQPRGLIVDFENRLGIRGKGNRSVLVEENQANQKDSALASRRNRLNCQNQTAFKGKVGTQTKGHEWVLHLEIVPEIVLQEWGSHWSLLPWVFLSLSFLRNQANWERTNQSQFLKAVSKL